MNDKKFPNRKRIVPVDPSNNIFDISPHDGRNDSQEFGFFRMELRDNGHLYLITTDEGENPMHINQNGHLIFTL